MLILNASAVRELYGMSEAFRCVTEAALAHAAGRTQVPPRAALSIPEPQAEVLVMPGVVDQQTFGLKAWYVFGREVTALPQSSALVLLIDPELGEVLMDGGIITDLRTGAMTGLVAERLAPSGVDTAAIVGTGIQARTQSLALIHAIDTLAEIRVTSRTEQRRERFAANLQSEIRAQYPDRTVRVIAVDSAEAACRGAGIAVAATTSTTPVLLASWFDSDALVCGVGSHAPGDAEIESELVARAQRVVVDTRAGAVDGAGDLQTAIAAGTLERSAVMELGELLSSGPTPGERAGLSVFKSVGFSAADIYSARFIARRAAAGSPERFDIHA
jgi:ornithine cyclodeaminase/alanine dehydrogenase-like protein (mu-crystallin family)